MIGIGFDRAFGISQSLVVDFRNGTVVQNAGGSRVCMFFLGFESVLSFFIGTLII